MEIIVVYCIKNWCDWIAIVSTLMEWLGIEYWIRGLPMVCLCCTQALGSTATGSIWDRLSFLSMIVDAFWLSTLAYRGWVEIVNDAYNFNWILTGQSCWPSIQTSTRKIVWQSLYYPGVPQFCSEIRLYDYQHQKLQHLTFTCGSRGRRPRVSYAAGENVFHLFTKLKISSIYYHTLNIIIGLVQSSNAPFERRKTSVVNIHYLC